MATPQVGGLVQITEGAIEEAAKFVGCYCPVIELLCPGSSSVRARLPNGKTELLLGSEYRFVNGSGAKDQPKAKLTGGSSDYYKAPINKPTTEGKDPYEAECNDIIEALDMRFAEANIFKAIWRRAAARLGNGKPGTTDLYDAEKIEFFGNRVLVQAQQSQGA